LIDFLHLDKMNDNDTQFIRTISQLQFVQSVNS